MPPVMSSGTAVPRREKARIPSPACTDSQQKAQTHAPITTPISGKKQKAYFIPHSLHSTKGIGMREYMENAITKLSRIEGRVFSLLLIRIFSFPADGNSVHNFCYGIRLLCHPDIKVSEKSYVADGLCVITASV